MSERNGSPTQSPSSPEMQELADEIGRKIRSELIGKFAVWVVTGGVAFLGLAVLGAWTVLLPILIKAVGGVPPSAVVAFDSTDLDEDHCPAGWSPFLLARARALVGAGDPLKAPQKMSADEKNRPLQGYTLRQHGGEQAHQLTPSELPKYNPVILKENDAAFNFRGTDVVPCLGDGCSQMLAITDGFRPGQHSNVALKIRGIGEDNPHNTMPPFVAVYYCKKEK